MSKTISEVEQSLLDSVARASDLYQGSTTKDFAQGLAYAVYAYKLFVAQADQPVIPPPFLKE